MIANRDRLDAAGGNDREAARDAGPRGEAVRPRVLVVEDEETISEFLRVGLSYEGWDVTVVGDGVSALRLARQESFALVVLDVMLPDLDGFAVCAKLREAGQDVAVIMLTAKAAVADRIAGLDLGADDYLTKPFSFEELLARVRAVLRRRGDAAAPAVLVGADIVLDPDAHEAWRGGRQLALTPTEFALLELFLRHPRRVFSRETLFNRIWGYDHVGEPNVVDVHISNLREELGDRSRRQIRTVYGVGFAFRPDDDAAPT